MTRSTSADIPDATLQELLIQRDQQLAALHESTSWRITAPLRWAVSALKRLLRKPAAALPHTKVPLREYAQWVRDFDSPNDEVCANLKVQIEGFAVLPLFSILLPCPSISLQDAAALDLLEATLASVRQQIYPNWELCITVDAPASAALQVLLRRSAQAEPRIKLAYVPATGAGSTLAQLSNHALSMVSSTVDNPSAWVVRLNATDLIAVKAINTLATAINDDEHCKIIYADEDVLDAGGQRAGPYFKCDWNPDLHLSHNLIGRFGIYRTALVQALSGYVDNSASCPDWTIAMDFDLSLRCMERVQAEQISHVPQVLFHARQHGLSGSSSIEGVLHVQDTATAAAPASAAGKLVLEAHLQRSGVAASVDNMSHGYRIRYDLPEQPLVSLIIPTRNGLDLLRQCIDSIQQKTTYPQFEIIVVDNGSDDPDALAYFKQIATEANIRVLRIDAPFNYSALNNAAVKVAKGALVGLINNDIEVISPDWLDELVCHALRPGVGAVGARLWFPDDTLQHGGVVLGIHGWAAHAHNHFPRGSLGYKGRMALAQNFSAVTGACLLVRKSSFEAVGGLNEDALKISCNDVDFCLKLQKIGLRNIWTPFADLYHHESATRGFEDTPAKKARFASELAYMQRHWAAELQNDPAYSPNLTLSAQDFGLAWPPRGRMQTRLATAAPAQSGLPPLYARLATLSRGRLRVAYFAENVQSSTFRYRAANMAEVLNTPSADGSAQALHTSAACFVVDDLKYAAHIAHIVRNADVLVISRARFDAGLAGLVQAFKSQGKKVWFDLDDLVVDPAAIALIMDTLGQAATDDNLNYWHSVVGRMAQAVRLCDGVITTNAYLANKLQAWQGQGVPNKAFPVKVVPNFINQAQWQVSEPLYLQKKASGFAVGVCTAGERIRLGYFSGSASHNRDFAMIVPALEAVMAADPRVELLIVGHMDMAVACGPHSLLNSHFAERVIKHGFTDYLTLQELIASVDFNLIPLQSNDFTHCKSELKYFDAAAVGTLSLASATYAYTHAIRHGENGYVVADDAWEAALHLAIAQRGNYAAMAQAAYQDVQTRFLWCQQRAALLQALDFNNTTVLKELKP